MTVVAEILFINASVFQEFVVCSNSKLYPVKPDINLLSSSSESRNM
jgi:hypothetical protein